MKNSILLYPVLFSFAVIMGFSSCKDKHHHDITADIQISAPLEGAMFNAGDTVFVYATITGSEALHGWEVIIRKKSDLSVVFSADAHDHAASYSISEYWVNNAGQHADMEVEVIAELDHDGGTQSKKLSFHCHN